MIDFIDRSMRMNYEDRRWIGDPISLLQSESTKLLSSIADADTDAVAADQSTVVVVAVVLFLLPLIRNYDKSINQSINR